MIPFEQRIAKLNCSKHGMEITSLNVAEKTVNKRAMCKQCKCNGMQLHREYLGEVLQEFIDKRRIELVTVIQQIQGEFNSKFDFIMSTLQQLKIEFETSLAEFSEDEYLTSIYDASFGWRIMTIKDLEQIGDLLSQNLEFDYDQVKIKQLSIDSDRFNKYIHVLEEIQNHLNTIIIPEQQLKVDQILPKYDREISQLTVSKDDQIIALVTLNSNIDIWRLENMTKVTLQGHEQIVNALIFSTHSNTMISGGREGTIKIWKYDHKWMIHDILIGHDDWITALAIGHMDKLLASASHEEILIWHYQDDHYSIVKKLNGHTDSIQSLEFNTINLLISCSFDKTVRLWEFTNQWQFKQQFYYHSDKVQKVACSNGTLFGSCSWDQSIRLYDQMTDDSYDCVQVLYGHQGKVYQIQFSKDSKILYSSSHDNTIKLWSQGETNLWECFHEIKQDFHIKLIAVGKECLVSSNYYEVFIYK